MPQKFIVAGAKNSPEKRQFAQELRRTMTPAERVLWKALRAHRLQGWHFRRQQIISGYIVDFYCHQADLVIEVDGPIHNTQQAADAYRTSVLTQRGLRVIRFTNQMVMMQLPAVLEAILAALGPPPSPLLKEGEQVEPAVGDEDS